MRKEMSAYYKKINQICFAVSIFCLLSGFLLTLAMIWEVFPNEETIQKAWLSLATFFGTALLVAMVNSAFSVRFISKTDQADQ